VQISLRFWLFSVGIATACDSVQTAMIAFMDSPRKRIMHRLLNHPDMMELVMPTAEVGIDRELILNFVAESLGSGKLYGLRSSNRLCDRLCDKM
jgi:hypothetical protein